ncbi:MAG: AAA family ATPase, partial [Deltaproteobacteria bacterium]|nr:AAA family ATPase [Deltaproteobacteria bacterium]
KLIDDLQTELPKAFENKIFQKKQSEIQKKYSKQQRRIFQEIEKLAEEKNVQIQKSKTGLQTVFLIDGKPATPESFRELSEEKRIEIEENIRVVQSEIEITVRGVNKITQALQSDLGELMEETTLFVVKDRLDRIRNVYRGSSDILEYLGRVQADIVENANQFLTTRKNAAPTEALLPPDAAGYFQRYRVNVLVDGNSRQGAPVIFESNPTFHNVFGQIEKRSYMGSVTTDFSMVQAGSLLKANGGFLIMEIESVLKNRFVWDALKRSLQNKHLFIEDMAAELGFGTASLRPKPIPLTVKVILMGSYEPFRMLQNHDSKFNKIFKVRADFDHEVELNDNTPQEYARFIARVCKEERLLPFTAKGVAAIVECGEKYIADKTKLSLRFGSIAGVLREADYWARQNKATLISNKYVIQAFNEHRFRHNLYEQKIHESYRDETILIDVAGAVTGQVNALAVYQIGDMAFGRPSRITAETYMGKQGIVNIEREAKLSGKTHDKGVLILSGYLGRTFAQNYPLSLAISITFEQSYGGIDGDSASSTELYAILSSLADIPIRQGISVTGSVNQKGQIQAIGGVNQKIEGFYDMCSGRSLTGKQGVLIPKANVKNLMLKRAVIDAVEKGRFHIYQVATVDEGIEILTGVPAGQRDGDCNYPEGTVYGAAQKKLKKYLERSFQLKKGFGLREDTTNE